MIRPDSRAIVITMSVLTPSHVVFFPWNENCSVSLPKPEELEQIFSSSKLLNVFSIEFPTINCTTAKVPEIEEVGVAVMDKWVWQ